MAEWRWFMAHWWQPGAVSTLPDRGYTDGETDTRRAQHAQKAEENLGYFAAVQSKVTGTSTYHHLPRTDILRSLGPRARGEGWLHTKL